MAAAVYDHFWRSVGGRNAEMLLLITLLVLAIAFLSAALLDSRSHIKQLGKVIDELEAKRAEDAKVMIKAMAVEPEKPVTAQEIVQKSKKRVKLRMSGSEREQILEREHDKKGQRVTNLAREIQKVYVPPKEK